MKLRSFPAKRSTKGAAFEADLERTTSNGRITVTRDGLMSGVTRREAGAVIAMTILAAAIRIPTLSAPLVEAHAFRQTQTAYTALIYHRQGIDLLHTPLPVLGPPWEVPFEFPLFQALAAGLMDVGLSVEVAVRELSLFFFLLTGIALWLFIRNVAGAFSAAAAVAAFFFSPFSLLWSRTSTIEFLATSAALGFCLAVSEWDRLGGRGRLVLAVSLGTVAALVKITTAAIWLAPALFLLRKRGLATVAVAIPMLAGAAWTKWADSIKETGEFTKHLTSPELLTWTFGTVADRFDYVTWLVWILWLTPLGLLGFAWVGFLRHDLRARPIWIWFGAVIILAMLVFPALYAHHPYYVAAISPAVAGLIGGGFVAALRARPRWFVVGWSALLIATTFAVTSGVWLSAFSSADPGHELELAQGIAAATEPDDLVLITGRDWSPAILFYANRRGLMLPDGAAMPPDAAMKYRIFDCPLPGHEGTCIERRP